MISSVCGRPSTSAPPTHTEEGLRAGLGLVLGIVLWALSLYLQLWFLPTHLQILTWDHTVGWLSTGHDST